MECTASVLTALIILITENYFKLPASTHLPACQSNCHLCVFCYRSSTPTAASCSNPPTPSSSTLNFLAVPSFSPATTLLPSSVSLFIFCIFQFNRLDSLAFLPCHGMLGIVIDIYPGLTRVYLEF